VDEPIKVTTVAQVNKNKKLCYRRQTSQRSVSVKSKYCHLLHNSVGATFTSPQQIEVGLIVLERHSQPTYNKLVYSAATRSTVVGVIDKLTVCEFVDHTNTLRPAVAKFSKSKMSHVDHVHLGNNYSLES